MSSSSHLCILRPAFALESVSMLIQYTPQRHTRDALQNSIYMRYLASFSIGNNAFITDPPHNGTLSLSGAQAPAGISTEPTDRIFGCRTKTRPILWRSCPLSTYLAAVYPCASLFVKRPIVSTKPLRRYVRVFRDNAAAHTVYYAAYTYSVQWAISSTRATFLGINS